MKTLQEIIGAEPIYHESDNAYTPSKASMKVAVQKKTNYKKVDYPNKYTEGYLKVLLLCEDQHYLECANGKRFRTGNHPVELALVAMHLLDAGFDLEFATLSGDSVKIENFAMPTEDENVMHFFDTYRERLDYPRVLSDVVNELDDTSPYIGVYIPGGHGAILGLPKSTDTKHALQWFIDNDKFIITICHGPSSLLSLAIDNDGEFPLKGYKMVCFPDAGDKLMTKAGYLPGEMPWFFGEKLEEQGIDLVNHLPQLGVTHIDRKLLSGDSPMVANKLGNIAAEQLLAYIEEQKEPTA